MKIHAFSKTFRGTRVLDFPGLTLEPGTVYGVIGANGSGKSTFAKILAGVLEPDRRGDCHDAPTLGYLPQKPYAYRLTVRQNLLLNGGDPARADALMEALQLAHLAEQKAHRLSGGETARMALARLMMKPYRLVILDEPTAAMDMESTILAEAAIRDYIRQTGCTLILVTHSLRQARALADRLLYFHRGSLAEQGECAMILRSPEDPRTKSFLDFYGMV